MSLNLATGNFSSGAHPTTHEVRRLARDMARQLADGASLDLRFVEGLYYRQDVATAEDELLPAFELMASCSRDSEKHYPNWSGRSGDPVGRLIKFGANQRATGDLGPLDEGAGENFIRNPTALGVVEGVVGAGGAMPTHWAIETGGATVTVSRASVAGWRGLRLRIQGVPTSDPLIYFEESGGIAATNLQTWAASACVALEAGSLSNINGVRFNMTQRDSGGGNLGAVFGSYFAPDDSLRRFSQPLTTANASTSAVQPWLQVDWTGGAVDITLLILVAQHELGSASSPMVGPDGSIGNATRAADVISGLTTTRASTAYDPDWSGEFGAIAGKPREFLPGVPVVGPRGLRTNRAKTNKIRNSRCLGAVAGKIGAGGALPTHWTAYQTDAGVEADLVGSGEDGFGAYVEIEYSGVSSGGVSEIRFEGVDQIAAAAGQPFSAQFGARVVSGGLGGVTDARIFLATFNGGGGWILQDERADLDDYLDRSYRRFKIEVPSLAGALTHVVPSTRFDFQAGATVNFRVRLYSPDLEQCPFCTALHLPAPGVIGEATRAADDIGLELGSWFSPDEMTVLFEFEPTTGSTGDNVRLWTIDDGTTADRLHGRISSSGLLNFFVSVGSAAQVNSGPAALAIVPGQRVVMAAGFAADNFAGSASGADQTVDASMDMPANLTVFRLGAWSAGDEQFDGYIRNVRFWPRRLSNADLETLVGN